MQRDIDVHFLRIAGRGGGPTSEAKWAVAAVDAAGRPEAVAQNLPRQRPVAELALRPPQAKGVCKRRTPLKARLRQRDRFKTGRALGVAAIAVIR